MASSNLTVALLRSLLANNGQGFSGPDDDSFVPALNQVSERLVQSGKWQGNMEKVVFGAAVNGSITLPPQFVSVLGAGFQCWPGVPIWSQFHEFMECGPGTWDQNFRWPYQFIDAGDQYATQYDVVAPGPLRVYSAAPDNAAVVRLFGLDADTGFPVTDSMGVLGEQVVLAFPFVQTTHRFASVSTVEKPITKNIINLWVLPTNGSAQYQIGAYQTVETVPQYHRYLVGNVQPLNTFPAIRTLCQRRYFPVRAETDIVYPPAIGAFKYGFQALNYEDLNRNKDADDQWTIAYKLMNNQTHATRGGARVEVDIQGFGGGHAFDWTN